MRNIISTILLLSLIALTPVTNAEERGAATADKRPQRFIYNSDADNMFLYVASPMQPADVHKYVDEIAEAGVTSLFMCPNYGMVMNYPSRVTELVGQGLSEEHAKQLAETAAQKPGTMERAVVNLNELVKAGHDPLGIVIDRARKRKLEVFITFRLNEAHCVDAPESFPTMMILSKFWREHPDWRIDKPGGTLSPLHREILGPRTSPIVASWLPAGMNFARPEVRQVRLAELRECCERYPIDGLDLDFQRFPMFFPIGTEAENAETMTAWIREVCEMTREVGRKRGRPILLSIRSMAKPEQNLGLGLDVPRWAREGLIDFVVASHYLRNDFALPIGDYRKVLPKEMPLYGSIEVEAEGETYRRLANQLFADGADGLLLFNYFTCRERGVEPDFDLVRELAKLQQTR